MSDFSPLVHSDMVSSRTELDEQFSGHSIDLDVWSPYYLPHWSSRSQSRATHWVHGGALHLNIPDHQPRWCPDTHEVPLRVSCVQTGNYSGPVGSTIGQQPFRPGLVVKEEQPTFWGYTPLYGQIEVRMRATITPRSMFAFWMSGIEDEPERSGEICVAEVFESGIHGGSVEVGMGVRRFRDLALDDDFSPASVSIDVTQFHTYGVEWRPGSVAFRVDGETLRRLDQAPDYPMQLMIGVFDFPDKAPSGANQAPVPELPIPELVVSSVRGIRFSPSDR